MFEIDSDHSQDCSPVVYTHSFEIAGENPSVDWKGFIDLKEDQHNLNINAANFTQSFEVKFTVKG